MVSLLPENAYQYARFRVGNAVTNTLGIPFAAGDTNIALLADDKLDVLRSAVAKARADGRGFVSYEDYPTMKDGTRPENFYRGGRLEQSDIDLYVKSATDPVFEMFTLVGAFNFKDTADGGFSIKDAYNFNASKSPKSRVAMDAYSERVYDAQDIDQTFTFNIAGTVPPKDSDANIFDYAYANNFISAAYNTIADSFAEKGSVKTEDAPLEFIALAREKLTNFFAANPEIQTTSLTDIDMPDFEDMPDVMQYFAAEKSSDGGFKIYDKFRDSAQDVVESLGGLLDIDVEIPSFDRMVGSIPDVNVNIPSPSSVLPVSILSDERMEQMRQAIDKRLYSDSIDDMAFGEAFAKSRRDGLETFNWRGDSYTTQYKEEADV